MKKKMMTMIVTLIGVGASLSHLNAQSWREARLRQAEELRQKKGEERPDVEDTKGKETITRKANPKEIFDQTVPVQTAVPLVELHRETTFKGMTAEQQINLVKKTLDSYMPNLETLNPWLATVGSVKKAMQDSYSKGPFARAYSPVHRFYYDKKKGKGDMKLIVYEFVKKTWPMAKKIIDGSIGKNWTTSERKSVLTRLEEFFDLAKKRVEDGFATKAKSEEVAAELRSYRDQCKAAAK